MSDSTAALPAEIVETFTVDDVDDIRHAIFTSQDVASELVYVQEWAGGMTVEVRAMTVDERADYLEAIQTPDGQKINWKALYPSIVIATCWVPAKDRSGAFVKGKSSTKLFRPGDEALIGGRSARAVERVARVGQRLSALEDDEDTTEAAAGE